MVWHLIQVNETYFVNTKSINQRTPYLIQIEPNPDFKVLYGSILLDD
ncbi:hypothetical protein [Bacillus horti]|uniref:Uncharacterized protein n=1 Tax=Caldalkalibacillus horti TaxID=77523 RepID=A0ABT9VV14_9BACI|nr:hypothetical protein [Bacillus horti]MDQ0164829.1 hypothetical protein [Bacillus horti]